MKERILIVDDEENIRFFLKEALIKTNYDIDLAKDGADALDKIKKNYYDLVLLDIRMPGMDGFTVMEKIQKLRPYLTVIIITAFGSSKVSQKAIEMGAYDYFNKPIDLKELRIVIKRALQKIKMEKELNTLRSEVEQQFDYKEIIGNSKSIKNIYEILDKIVDKDVTVLVTGESGTGKELIARAIHYNSSRKDQPFIKMNCAAIPENLLESELFGYEKGAFTGAERQKIGKFERANNGTIFLDEIGDMPENTQAKLLRVLQEREIERIGGYDSIFINIRIIAATNQKLAEKVKNGNFRNDLFFRLNVININLPALRERKEDIPELCSFFMSMYSKQFGRSLKRIHPKCMEAIQAYDWPGNIRELENVIQRAVVLSANSEFTCEALPDNIRMNQNHYTQTPQFTYDWEKTFQEQIDSITTYYERKFLSDILLSFHGTKEELSDKLAISRKSLYNKLNKYEL